MFSFRQKIFISYIVVFFVFLIMMLPFVSQWVHQIVVHVMEERATEIIHNIHEAPNNEALIRRLKDQKSLIFFRVSVISNERKVLYDSHTKRLLGPKFSQDYVVDHPEVLQAFQEGVGYHEDYSELLSQKFAYFAKAFNFHGKSYVLRTAFPYDYLVELTKNFEIGFLIFAIAILLLFSFMTWFIIHFLTKPIQTIINVVKPYQEGLQTELPEINIGVTNPNDDFGKLAMTLNNLSERIQQHINTITNERNEKEAILESLIEGVIGVDPNLVIDYANYTAAKILNYPDQEIVGKPFRLLNQEKFETLLWQCQAEKKILTDTIQINIEGKKTYLDVIAAPKKQYQGAILVLQDKTSHYKIFEMRRDFIANASHELKTPITIIRGFAEALHDNPELPRETQLDVTSKIVRNCQRMAALIKDLLTLADIENIPSSRLSECDIEELVKKCSTMLIDVFPTAKIRIEKKQGDVIFIADADLLELAIMNLIENAAKYSPSPAQIHVTLDQTMERIKVTITDQGIGIPSTDIEHIFERFYTVDKAHSQKMGGSGLGLSIVKTIVEKHFGTISVQSELGRGTTFTLSFPKKHPSLVDS